MGAGLKQTRGCCGRYLCVEGEIARPGAAVAWRSATVAGNGHGGEPGEPDAALVVTALYEEHVAAIAGQAGLF
jgi:hypothetical protein